MRGPSAEDHRLRPSPVSKERIAQIEALASPFRLRLLRFLMDGGTVEDAKEVSTRSPEAIEEDVEALIEGGILERRPAEGTSHDVVLVPDLARLLEVGETLRGLSFSWGWSPDAHRAPPRWEPPPSETPSLTIIHGTTMGRSFTLEPGLGRPDRGWVIGRGEEVDVPLEEDPYVEPEAAEIDRREGDLELVDLRIADRRVSLNGERLDRGERRKISDGDLLGVGRTVLWYRS